MRKWLETLPAALTKYQHMGAAAQTSVSASLLAKSGYDGDRSVLDGEYGFGRFYNPHHWDPADLVKDLGTVWKMLNMLYKPYPACAIMHSALAGFITIVEKHGLKAEQIDRVRVQLPAFWGGIPLWESRTVSNQVEASFNAYYCLACAAYRIPRVEWQSEATIRDPRVLDFMKRIDCSPDMDWGRKRLDAPSTYPSNVEVDAFGHCYREESTRSSTTPVTSVSDYRFLMSDAELELKFRENAEAVIGPIRADQLISAVARLDACQDLGPLSAALSK